MNYIFFDVDGVLNGTDENGYYIKEEIQIEKVLILCDIAKKTNSKLVMSSSWRTAWDEKGILKKQRQSNKLLQDILTRENTPIHSITPVIKYKRDKEIKQWIKDNMNKNDNFLCIDDEQDYYKNDIFFKNKFLHTSTGTHDGYWLTGDIVGLFPKHIEEAIILLKRNS